MKGLGKSSLTPANWDGHSAWLSDSGFLFDPVRGFTYSMNDTASFIYKMLESGHGLLDVVDAVVNKFDIDPATARHDVEDFLAQMREAGLE